MFSIFRPKQKPPAKTAARAPVPLDRDALKAEALANARRAREQIGAENLERLGQLLGEQMKSQGLKAREQIRAMDKGHVADNIKLLLKDE